MMRCRSFWNPSESDEPHFALIAIRAPSPPRRLPVAAPAASQSRLHCSNFLIFPSTSVSWGSMLLVSVFSLSRAVNQRSSMSTVKSMTFCARAGVGTTAKARMRAMKSEPREGINPPAQCGWEGRGGRQENGDVQAGTPYWAPMRHRFLWSIWPVLLAVTTSSCLDLGPVTDDDTPIEIKLDFCASRPPSWFAVQTGTNPYEVLVQDAAGTFTFQARQRTAVAYVLESGSASHLHLIFTTKGDLEDISG